ncbi:MAG: tRNA dihydrouridine synthase DusB [bacterium]
MPSSLFKNRVILAPMSTYNTAAFLRVAAESGCDMAFTGLLSAFGLVMPGSKTVRMLEEPPEGLELAVQLFGSDPDTVARAAELVAGWGRAAAIDINMGCPVKKVVKTSAGAALMRNPEHAAAIVREASRRVGLPVTVKIRSGWDAGEVNAVEVARACEEAGAAAVSIHPRTCSQGFGDSADWGLIRRVKEAVGVPVIGSGDIISPEDVKLMMEETGCDSVMIGRAALQDPTLVGRAAHFLRTGELSPEPPREERIKLLLRHLELEVEQSGERRGVRKMRKFFASCTRGLPRSAELRDTLMKAKVPETVEKILAGYLAGPPPGEKSTGPPCGAGESE